MLRFFAVPAWQLGATTKKGSNAPAAEPELTPPKELSVEMIERALSGVEYRGVAAFERARQLVQDGKGPHVYARPPTDLPALLRTSDQLLTFSKQESGERARFWRCVCGARLVVQTTLYRPSSMRCNQCGETSELDPDRSQSESGIIDLNQIELNGSRERMAKFFREAMARGWVVAVEQS